MRKIELRAKQFARKYLENNMNGTKTALETYNPKNKNVANAIASENLQKPIFQEAIIAEMDNRGLTDEVLDEELRYVVKQKQQLSPKVSAIQEANKLKRRYPKETNQHLHLELQLPTKELREAKLKDLLQELEQLREKRA